MIRLEAVTKEFRAGTFGGTRIPAVSEVTFEVRPGEVVALIGESGSGKTTIGRMILRLTDVTRGSIRVDDRDVASLRGRALRRYYGAVQGIFQDPFSSYNPVFKADRVLELVRRLGRLTEAEWRARLGRALEAVVLEPSAVLGKYPHELSGGQLQRLLIARALLLDIRYLVADEIISMLDASTRIDVLNLLGTLRERGVGILFITHDLSLGHYISDRAVILRRGEIVEAGDTQEVFARPQHPYTKMLLASVPGITERWGARPARVAAAPRERPAT